MKSTLVVVELDKKCYRYLVQVADIVIDRVELVEITKNHQAYSVPEDFFHGWFLWNLQNDTEFRQRIKSVLRCRDRLAVINISPPCTSVGLKSSEMSLKKTHDHVELLTMLSWFSTFGGAYSNLGDEFEKCAEMAGKISVHQMKLALQLGDPFLLSRCKLYYSIALIQRGLIRPAKQIVRSEYHFAKKEQEADPKLLKMCLGIWSKLIYTKHQSLAKGNNYTK